MEEKDKRKLRYLNTLLHNSRTSMNVVKRLWIYKFKTDDAEFQKVYKVLTGYDESYVTVKVVNVERENRRARLEEFGIKSTRSQKLA